MEVTMRIAPLVVAVMTSAAGVSAQVGAPSTQPPSARQLFEAGQYEQAIGLINTQRQTMSAGPTDEFLAGQIYVRMKNNEKAREEFAKIAASEDPVWRLIGESLTRLLDGNATDALAKLTEASTQLAAQEPPPPPTPPSPQSPPVVFKATEKFVVAYQTGLVKARLEDWPGAATAFDRAAELDPAFAYAHYYAGQAYSHLKRPDRMALHFDHFLTVAPNAPERGSVMSMLRTIRGR